MSQPDEDPISEDLFGSSSSDEGRADDGLNDDDVPGAVPEMIRRMTALGLAGFFSTESAIRRAFGDTVPQDWVNFASDQSERTRKEFIDRMAGEMGRSLSTLDLADLLGQLLEGRTVEINTRIRLSEKDPDAPHADAKIDSRIEFEDE